MTEESAERLHTKDLIDVVLKLNDTINFYWNFYVVSVSGLAFWQLTTKEPFDFRTKVVITLGFVIFVLMNGSGLYKHYSFLEAIKEELEDRVDNLDLKNKDIANVIKRKSRIPFEAKVILIHIFIDIPLLALIWS